MFEREGHGAAAGAQVKNFRVGRHIGRLQHLQRPQHQGFGVRPRHQHPGIYLQAQAKKLLAADDVGQGFTGRPAQAQGPKMPGDFFGQFVGVVRQQPGPGIAGFAQCMQQQQLGVESLQPQRLGGGQGLRASRLVHRRALIAL